MRNVVGIVLLFVLPFLSGAEGCKCSTAKVTRVELAKGYEAGKAIEPTTTFAGTDKVHLIVRTAHVPKDTKLTVEWIAVEAAGATNFKINAADLTMNESRDGVFTFYNDLKPFPPGKYKAVVYLNDKQVKEAEFTIQ